MYKYRITTDSYLGFQIQWGFRYLPFLWFNDHKTYTSAEGAEEGYEKRLNFKVIKYL